MTTTPPDPRSLTREEIRKIQSERLVEMLAEIIPQNSFWTTRLKEAGIDPATIKSVEDLPRLPTVTKAEILADQAAHPPYGSNLTYEFDAYSRLHQTSGTTGSPMRWMDTPTCWNWLMRCWSQIYQIIRLTPQDRLVFPFSFGPFLGFWAGFEGAVRLGNLCLPGGGMSSQARLELIEQHGATFVCCTPTYALRLAEIAREQGIDLAGNSVRIILVAGEPGGNIPATRHAIETAWGARVIDHWGMTEVGALAVESIDRPGSLYMLETECIAEIIDPKTGQPVAVGEEGELVITNLGRLGSPLIRYRTGDRVRAEIPAADDDLQMLCLDGGILGRTDDMITIRGNNVYPSKLEGILREFDDIVEYRIEVSTRKSMHHVKIEIEPQPHISESEAKFQLASQLAEAIKDRQNFHAEIKVVPSGSLPRFELKGRRFFRVD
ncbi:Phenylacetate-coenzyme A ligase [Symmachiella macrocystis]|uniref:Phenylacetate-coenzyme A ligase n=1 Tax=Symmachiella macrocystis TaxID=2527985 RepID=A0A5C6BS94_9PLAN|nr:AMP-binding protein [Symmachiella macrocystis]TWU13759.1 Phenylacetate-coenzyme A ligase [Symmachiella macrocystis]